MPALYIANVGRQRHAFLYRLPESQQTVKIDIAPGRQERVSGRDDEVATVRAIIDQHLKYGLVTAEAAHRSKAFSGLCYSIDKPIDVDKLMAAHERNGELLRLASAENLAREAAAIYAGTRATTAMQPGALAGIEAEVIEEPADRFDRTQRLHIGFMATPTGAPTRAAQRRGLN